MTSLLILGSASLGFLIGWYLREVKYHYDARMREDKIMRIIQDRVEREAANR